MKKAGGRKKMEKEVEDEEIILSIMNRKQNYIKIDWMVSLVQIDIQIKFDWVTQHYGIRKWKLWNKKNGWMGIIFNGVMLFVNE